jgi:hypothetical protein
MSSEHSGGALPEARDVNLRPHLKREQVSPERQLTPFISPTSGAGEADLEIANSQNGQPDSGQRTRTLRDSADADLKWCAAPRTQLWLRRSELGLSLARMSFS